WGYTSLGYGFSSRVGGLAFGPYHHPVLWMLPTVGSFCTARVVLVCSSLLVGCGWLFFQFQLAGPRPPTKQALGHLLKLCRFLGWRFWRVPAVSGRSALSRIRLCRLGFRCVQCVLV